MSGSQQSACTVPEASDTCGFEVPAGPGLSAVTPIEILFIIDELCALGGAERVLLRVVNRLPRGRFSPAVLTFRIDAALNIGDLIACPLHVYPLRRTYDAQAFLVANRIRRLIKRRNVQIVHTFHETSDLWAAPIAQLSGCPILVSSRRDMGFNRQPKHRLAYRWMGKRFAQIHAVSEQVRQWHIENDALEPKRVLTVHNGIDLPTADTGASKQLLRNRLGLGHASHLVTFVGHVRRVKGVDVLLSAAAQVIREVPGAVFVVAGRDREPEYAKELRSAAERLGLTQNFLFLGEVADIPGLLRASDMFCLLSRTEGLSNALLEAMASGLPCVATRVGGNPEIVIEGKNGFLIDNEDAGAAAARMLRLFQNPALCESLGAEARKTVERSFTTEAMMTRLIDSYEYLLALTPARKT